MHLEGAHVLQVETCLASGRRSGRTWRPHAHTIAVSPATDCGPSCPRSCGDAEGSSGSSGVSRLGVGCSTQTLADRRPRLRYRRPPLPRQRFSSIPRKVSANADWYNSVGPSEGASDRIAAGARNGRLYRVRRSPSGYSFNPASIASGTFDFVAVAEHELGEVLGRISGLSGSNPSWGTPFDLLRYSGNGAMSFSGRRAGVFLGRWRRDRSRRLQRFRIGRRSRRLGNLVVYDRRAGRFHLSRSAQIRVVERSDRAGRHRLECER